MISSKIWAKLKTLLAIELGRWMGGMRADLNEDGDHSDAMRALSCLSEVGVQILVIMDQLDLNKRHNHTDHYKPNSSNEQNMFASFT